MEPVTSPVMSSVMMSVRPIFRPRTHEDWQSYRPEIERLYRDHQMKLREVKRFMESRHGFVASEKQYKDRLSAWHVRKNIKAKEVHIMIRKQQKRAAQGKRTAFRVGGQQVDSRRIARFIRRYRSSWDFSVSSSSPEPETPSDMSCYTPVSRPATPEILESSEDILPDQPPVMNMTPHIHTMHPHHHHHHHHHGGIEYHHYNPSSVIENLFPEPDQTVNDPLFDPGFYHQHHQHQHQTITSSPSVWDQLESYQDQLTVLHKKLVETTQDYADGEQMGYHV
ncbi:hypothetical protein VTN02DRAFT_3559 [Thermoascus thermophilus]